MRTSTIYRAMSGAYRTIIFTQTVDAFLQRKGRQWAKFERELLRRLDERDTLSGELAEARAELTKAKLYISWHVGEPGVIE